MDIPKSKDPRRIDLEGKVLVAHQAEFMPWLGFISKAAMGDLYIIFDDTQFKKKYFENRNRIRFPNSQGWIWLNIPIKNKDRIPNMLDVEMSDKKWIEKHLAIIKSSYSRAPYFDVIYQELKTLYRSIDSDKLVVFNIAIIEYAFKKFGINIPVERVSNLKRKGFNIQGKGTELILSLVKEVGADVLVAGTSGKNYLDKEMFKNEGIELVFQDYHHPSYNQIHGNFVPYMSFIDLLFNYGAEGARNILNKSNYINAENFTYENNSNWSTFG